MIGYAYEERRMTTRGKTAPTNGQFMFPKNGIDRNRSGTLMSQSEFLRIEES